jgi:hypothetical protein
MEIAKNVRVVEKSTKRVYEGIIHNDTNMFVGQDITVSMETIQKDFTPLIDKITSLDEYQKLAARTLPDLTEFYVGRTMIDNIHEDANIVHCIYGVDTELGEILDLYKKSFAYRKSFDRTNLLEEVCDIMWYLAGGCTINELSLNNIINELEFHGSLIPTEDYPDLDIMADLYNLVQDYRKGSAVIERLLISLVSSEEELFRGLTNNINKLIIRYPDKFSNDNAVNRNLDVERNQLEQ